MQVDAIYQPIAHLDSLSRADYMVPPSSTKEHSVHSRRRPFRGYWADWKWELLLLAVGILLLVVTAGMLYKISGSNLDS